MENNDKESTQQTQMQRGGRLFAETKRKLAAGEKIELSDDDLQILKSFLEQMHENGTLDEIANADIIKFVAEKLPENQKQEERTITHEEKLFNATKAKFDAGEKLDLSPNEVLSIQQHIVRGHDLSSYNQEENATFEQQIFQIGNQLFDEKNPDLVARGISTDINDIYFIIEYMKKFRTSSNTQFFDSVNEQIKKEQGENAPSLSSKIQYYVIQNSEQNEQILKAFSALNTTSQQEIIDYAQMQLEQAEDDEDREEIQNIIDTLSNLKSQKQQEEQNEADDIQEPAEQEEKQTASTAETQAPEPAPVIKEAEAEPMSEPEENQTTPRTEKRSGEELYNLTLKHRNVVTDELTLDELLTLNKYLADMSRNQPKDNDSTSQNIKALHNLVRQTVQSHYEDFLQQPYDLARRLMKEDDLLLKNVLQQAPIERGFDVKLLTYSLNRTRHTEGQSNIEHRFEYFDRPKNDKRSYKQFLFDKFYETPTAEVLASMGRKDLYDFRDNMEKYLSSHQEVEDAKKKELVSQINQAISSQRKERKDDKKQEQQETVAEATSASEQPTAMQTETQSENEQENKPKIGRFDAEFIENWQKKREDAEEDLRLRTLHGITSLKQSMDTLGDELDSDTRSTLNEALDNKFSENFKNQENGEKGEYYKILLEWATSPEAYKVEDFRNCIEAFYPNGAVKNGPESAELDNLMQEISKYRQEHNMEPISFGHEVNGKNYDTPANKSETVTDETTAMPSETIEHEKSTIEQKQESEVTPKSVEEEEKQQPQSEEDRIKALYNHIAEVGWHEIPYEEQLAISNRDLLMLVKYAKIQKENARGAENYDSISSTYIDLYMQGIIRLEKSDYENNQFVELGSSAKEEDLLFLKDYIDTVFDDYPTGKDADEYLAFVAAVNTKRAEKGLSTSLEDEFNKLDHANDQESVVQNVEPATQEAEPIAEIETEPQVQPNIEQENTTGGTIIIGPASPDTPIAEPVPESEPIIIGGSEPEPEPEPENRADLYNTVSIENILELTKEEPETIKEALQGYPSRAITGMYKMIQYNIDQGHVTAGDENLAKFYEVATNHILEIIKNDTRLTDEFSLDEIRERAELLQTYAQDFVGKDIAFADSHDTDFYRFQLDTFTKSAQDENDGNTENSLNNDGAGTIIIDNSDDNEDDNINAYEILESAAKSGMLPMDVFDENDGAIHYYEDVIENQNRKVRNSRIERLNNFFDNVELEHDEEWRRFASSIVGNKIIGGKGNYQVEDLKAEMREIAEQRAILEVIEENRTAGISVNDMSDLQGNMADKVLDQMEFLTAQLVSAQMVKEAYAEMTKDIELKTDDKGNLTKESQIALRDKMMSTIEEIGNTDTGGFWERMKNRVQRFMEPEDDEDYERTSPKSRKYIISDSVAINLNQKNKERLEKDINDSKADKGSQTSTLLHKLRERHENMKKKFAKTYPALSAAYSGVKGFALVGAVAKYAPGVLPYYIGYNVCKAWYGVHKGYTKYKQRGGQGGFGSYWRNNKIQVTATVASTALTMFGLKEERAYLALTTGLASAAPEFAHGRWKVGLVKLATTAYGAYLGLGDKFSSNENVNDNDLQNMLKQQELMDKEVEQQKATFNIYRPAENLSQDTSQSTDTIEDQQSTSNDNNNQHHAPAKHTTPTVNNDDEIARVKEAVKFTAPEIERDAPGDDLASSGSAIGDFTLPEYVEQPPHPPALSNAETLFVNDQAMGDVTLKQAENGFSIHYRSDIDGQNHTEMMIEQDGVKHCVIQQEDGSMRYMTPAEEEKFMYSVNRICTECHNDIAYDKDLLNHIHNSPTVQSMEEAAFYEREEFQELARAKDTIASAEETTVNEPQSPTVNNEKSDNLTANNIDNESNINNEASNTVSETLSSATSHGLTGEALYTHTSGDTSISVYENGFHGIEKDESGTVTQWGIKVEDGSAHGYIQTADGEKVMTPQQIDYYNKLSSDYLMKNDNPARDQVIELQGNISNAVNQEDNSATSVTNVVENSESKNLPFAIGNDYDPITKQPIQIITTQGENGFYGTDRDANGNELRNWSITIDENGVRHATIHDANGAVKMSDKEFTKYMSQTMELRNPQNEAQSHTSELINQILDSRIQIDGANLQYNDTSLFLSTSPDGKDGVLWTMNDNEPPHFYEITNGQKNEIDFARACELEEDIDREVQKLPAGNFRDQLYNFVADCQMKAAFENANNLDIYAQECNLALNLPPAQETIVADDLSRVTNISNDGILVIEKNGTMTYAYHDPSAQGDIRMVRIDADGVKHPINSQTTTAQEFFAENRELFEKAEIMHSDFAMAAYGMDSGSENMTTLDQPAAATLYQGENITVKYNQDGFSITENGVTMTVVERDGHVVCEKIDANGQHTPMTSKELQDFNNQLKQYTQGDIETKRLLMWDQATSQHTEAISEQLNNNAFKTPYAQSDNPAIMALDGHSFVDTRPFNAEMLEQKFGLVNPDAIQEQLSRTHSEIANNTLDTRSAFSFSRAENGFSITCLDETRAMVLDANGQAHMLIAKGNGAPHEMTTEQTRNFLKALQNNILPKDTDVFYKVAGTYFDQHPELSGNTTTNSVDLSHLHIMAATERATEFGLTGGDTRSVETGQYKGTVVTKAENGWQIRYPEGNSVILKAENGTLSGMFIDADDKVTNMKPQEVEQYRQAAADAYKNSRTTYGETSANMGIRAGGINKGNSYA